MSQQELEEYVSRALTAGSPEEEIRTSLKTAGWDDSAIAAALASVRAKAGTVVTETPPAPEPANPSASDSVIPVEPASVNQPTSTPRALQKQVIGILGTILIIGAGVAYAYTKQVWPFSSRLKEDAIIASLFSNMSQIKSASYGVTFSLVSEARSANTKALSAAFPESDKEKEKYKRDADRFAFLQNTHLILEEEKNIRDASYPTTLASAGISARDPLSGKPYTYRATSGDYELSIAFETSEAIELVKNPPPGMQGAVTVKEQTATFTSESPSFYYFRASPQRPALIEFASMLEDEELLQWLPGSIDASFKASGILQESSGENVDTKFQFGANINLDDFLMNFDVELIKKSDTYYARVNKFPGLFFVDFSKVKQRWIRIRPEDQAFALGDMADITTIMTNASNTDSSGQESSADLFEEFSWLMRRMEEEKILTAERQPDDPAKEHLRKYKIVLHKERIASSYERIAEEAEKMFGKNAIIKPDSATLAYIKNGDLDPVFDYIASNTDIFVWMNPKTSLPEQFEYSFRFVPSGNARAFQDKQLRITASVLLENINTPITIDAPNEFMTAEDAAIAMSGITREEYRFNKQSKNIQNIRAALEGYKSITGSYPSVLSDLTKRRKDVRPPESVKHMNEEPPLYLDDVPFLTAAPVDAYTEKPFAYARRGNDYTLTYSIQLPPYQKGSALSYSIYSSSYRASAPNGGTQTFALKFANGSNTANALLVSAEAAAEAAKDSDKDNLADSLELYIGTDPRKKDSDGDGTNDGIEIQKNSNPLGSGYLEYSDYGGGFFF